MATIFLPVLSFMVPMLLSALVIAFCIWRMKRAGGRSPINTKSEKITCTFAKRAVSCAPSPRCPRRNFTKKPHDHVRPTKHRRLPQRRAANARCGSVCALRVRRTRHHRLTCPPSTEGRLPDLPRKRECPRTLFRGHFFARSLRSSIRFARRHAWRRATRLPLRKRRQCGGHYDWQQRYGFQVRPVRAAVPLRMPMPARVGSTIAALAQSGRAPAYEAGGRGFESRMPRHWIAQ